MMVADSCDCNLYPDINNMRQNQPLAGALELSDSMPTSFAVRVVQLAFLILQLANRSASHAHHVTTLLRKVG